MNLPSDASPGTGASLGMTSRLAAGNTGEAAAGTVRLEVKDLEIRLAGSAADVVSEISFTVRSGEVLGLVGESGSGKTTVALALLGHARRGLEIVAGEVRVDGVDLLALRPAEVRAMRGCKVAYVPQDPAAALNPTLRVPALVEEALRAHPGAADAAAGAPAAPRGGRPRGRGPGPRGRARPH